MFMLQRMHALAVGGADGAFVANAVDFDGTNDYLSAASGLSGTSDTSTGIFSFWFRLDGGDGANLFLTSNVSGTFEFRRNTSNQFRFTMFGVSAGRFDFETSNTHQQSSTWKHLLASWNTNFSAGNKLAQLYISDVSDLSIALDADAAFNIDYTVAGATTIGSAANNSSKFNGCLAEVYYAQGQYLDFSNSANRRKFISATGKPVNLGSDGSLPTGVAPTVYLNDTAALFGTNKGSGGNFTINGTLDTASTSPSD